MQHKSMPTIRSYLTLPYVEAMERHGIDATAILARHGIRRADLAQPYLRLPLTAFLAVTIEAAASMNDIYLGLRLGADLCPEQVSSFGLLMATSPTLRDALTSFSSWAFAMQEGWQLFLVAGDAAADYIYRVEGDGLSKRHDVEFSLANLCTLIRTRMGPNWRPAEVHFEHAQPPQLRLYERIFGCPVFFDQPCNKIVVSNADLNQRSARLNHALIPLIDAHLRSLGEEADPATTAHKAGLAVAQILGNKSVKIEAVAQDIGLSVRSLQRRLAEEGTSFREVVRRERQRVAEKLLSRRRRCSMTEIAISAGYSDGTVFAHAFKTWTGSAPSRYGSKIAAGKTALPN